VDPDAFLRNGLRDLYPEMSQSQPLVLGRLISILPFDTNSAPSIILLSGLPPRIGDTIHFALHPPSHPLSMHRSKTPPVYPSGVWEVVAFLLSFSCSHICFEYALTLFLPLLDIIQCHLALTLSHCLSHSLPTMCLLVHPYHSHYRLHAL